MGNDTPKLIWIDKEIDNNENRGYQGRIKKLAKLEVFKSINDGMNKIIEFKFEKVFVMIRGTMFEDFIKLFKQEKKKICCVLHIIVFTTHTSLVKEICKNDEDISAGYIYNHINIFENIEDVIKAIKNRRKIEDNVEELEIFEKIENYEDLILPIYFPEFLENITIEEIHAFNLYLTSFGKEIKDLISQLEDTSEIPNEIICKYWIKAYTYETDFYNIIKKRLQQKKGKFYVPYIKMMYEGIKNKVFESVTNENLYRGGKISKKELMKIKEYLDSNNNDVNDLPKAIFYFRAFQSYSKDIEVAYGFMEKSNNSQFYKKSLFIIKGNNKNLEEQLFSNAYIKKFSRYEEEEEVLFFPYSCFEVKKIKETQDHVKIYLEYLGKYKALINQKKPNIKKDIPITNFGKEIVQLGLVDYKFKKFWETKKEIQLKEGDASCILYLENKKILYSINNLIILYDIGENKIIQNKKIHDKEINNLLKISETKIISCSKDKTIKFIEIKKDYSDFEEYNILEIHSDEVNQVIKFKKDNLYASCSNDKIIFIWEINDNKIEIKKVLLENTAQIISILELNNEIVSISINGYLKFWNDIYCIKILKGFHNPLKNSLKYFEDNIISIGTKTRIIFVDSFKKEKIKIFTFNHFCFSIGYFDKKIFIGMTNNKNISLLREYIIDEKLGQINIDYIGKGKDLSENISYIEVIDDNTIISSNKGNFIKIWKKTEKKPRILQENILDFNNKLNDKEDENLIINNEEKKIEIFKEFRRR